MFSYEKLEVYSKSFDLNKSIYKFLKEKASIPSFAKNQLGRASMSIMLNIAEGSAKFSKRDRRNFFIIARGSAFESASLVNFLASEQEIPEDLRKKLYHGFEEISRMLYMMIQNLEEDKKGLKTSSS